MRERDEQQHDAAGEIRPQRALGDRGRSTTRRHTTIPAATGTRPQRPTVHGAATLVGGLRPCLLRRTRPGVDDVGRPSRSGRAAPGGPRRPLSRHDWSLPIRLPTTVRVADPHPTEQSMPNCRRSCGGRRPEGTRLPAQERPDLGQMREDQWLRSGCAPAPHVPRRGYVPRSCRCLGAPAGILSGMVDLHNATPETMWRESRCPAAGHPGSRSSSRSVVQRRTSCRWCCPTTSTTSTGSRWRTCPGVADYTEMLAVRHCVLLPDRARRDLCSDVRATCSLGAGAVGGVQVVDRTACRHLVDTHGHAARGGGVDRDAGLAHHAPGLHVRVVVDGLNNPRGVSPVGRGETPRAIQEAR